MGRRDGSKNGRLERRAGERSDLTRNAINAEPVRQIGRELEREQGVVEQQQLTDVSTHRRVSGQFQQAAVIVIELQFTR